MKAIHLSDVHLPFPLLAVPPHDWLGKRLLGGANYLLKRRARYLGGPSKLTALHRFCASENIDLVLFTGDSTTLGTEYELRMARRTLAPFIEGSWDFVHVPGNHDLYLPDALREQRWHRAFAGTCETDLPEYRCDDLWPLVRLIGEDVAVVAVNSARPNPQPWRSSGRIPDIQLEALGRVLADPRVRPRFVFVLTHYAPVRADGSPDTHEHGLENADELLAVLAPLERGVLLHGHIHRTYHRRLPEIPVFNAGSATYAGREGCWLFELTGGELRARQGRLVRRDWTFDTEPSIAVPFPLPLGEG